MWYIPQCLLMNPGFRERLTSALMKTMALVALLAIFAFMTQLYQEYQRDAALSYIQTRQQQQASLDEIATLRRECVLRGVATYVVDVNGVSSFTWLKERIPTLAEKAPDASR